MARLTSSRSARAADVSSKLLPKRVLSIGSPNQKYSRSGRGIGVAPTPRIDRRRREAHQLLVKTGELTVDRRVLVDDHVEHLVGADGRERDDRIAVLDREPREADALPPQELVLLAAPLVDLARRLRGRPRSSADRASGRGRCHGYREPSHPRSGGRARSEPRSGRARQDRGSASRRCFQISAIMNGRSRNP